MKRERMVKAIKNNTRDDGRWFRISDAAETADAASDPVQVLIYGEIGESWWADSVPAPEFVRALAAIDTNAAIDFHIHSPGGDVFDGIAIASAIRARKGRTVAYVDGLAASAASYIAVAADEVVMAVGAEMMIHDASGLCWGNAADMQKMADDLSHISGNIASLYAEKAGEDTSAWRERMLAETWYTADEAVAAGLADRVDRAREADAKNAFDLTIFAHAGRQDAPPPALPGRARDHMPPARPAEPTTQKEGVAMSDTVIKGLRERLGIKADAELDEAGLLAALDETLMEQTAPTAAGAPAGTVLVDEGTLTELQASAALGRAAHERQVAADREAAVMNAVNTGRIAASRADNWRTQLEADPGAVEVLNSLPENTIPLKPAGYTGDQEASTDDDVRNTEAYKNWSI